MRDGDSGWKTAGDGALASASLSRRWVIGSGGLAAAFAFAPRSMRAMGAPEEGPVVATSMGGVRGQALAGGVRVFRGIPFAQPPVGNLRFCPPVAPKAWAKVRDASKFAMAATQPGDAHSGEDCLYLNVWTPAAAGPHPVFVWIHGGGYTGGRAWDPIFDGSQFAREGIVLVTVAYRLGVFGFMDLGPLLGAEFADSGNNALRDLLAALRWVNGNVAAFGGDPARVTVGGESAGAKAAAALMGVPEARELFQSVISESGGGERVVTAAEASAIAHDFGERWRRAHPREGTEAGAFDDLRTAPAAELIATQGELIAGSKLHFPFRPETGEGLLPRRPVDLVADGSARGKRLLLGTNRDESALFLGPHPPADPTARDLGNVSLARFNEVFRRYATVYPKMTAEERRVRAVTAEEYWVPSVRLADAHTEAGGRAWMYRLDFAQRSGKMAGEAFHSLDLGLVWERMNGPEGEREESRQLARSMHEAWCAFTRGEAPGARGLPGWPEYEAKDRRTMILDRTSRVERMPFEAELRLWDGVL